MQYVSFRMLPSTGAATSCEVPVLKITTILANCSAYVQKIKFTMSR
jgi:hypothetical protein